jgi:hypothetical protein
VFSATYVAIHVKSPKNVYSAKAIDMMSFAKLNFSLAEGVNPANHMPGTTLTSHVKMDSTKNVWDAFYRVYAHSVFAIVSQRLCQCTETEVNELILDDEPCLLRQQVRGLYAISGSGWADTAISIFCPCTNLAQIDREMRAREGQENLRTSRSFRRHKAYIELETRQPTLVQPMSYRPSRQTSNRFVGERPGGRHISLENVTLEEVTFRGNPRAVKIEGTASGKNGSTATGPQGIDHNVKPCHTVLNRGLASLMDTASHAISDCPPTENLGKRGSTEQLSQHSMARCSTPDRKSSLVGPIRKSHLLENCAIIEIKSQSNTVQHPLEKCDTVATSADVVEKSHMLEDCAVIEIKQQSITVQHGLEYCDTVVTSAEVVEEHENPTGTVGGLGLEEYDRVATSADVVGKYEDSTGNVEHLSLMECDTVVTTSAGAEGGHSLTKCDPVAATSTETIEHTLLDCTGVIVNLSPDLQRHNLGECTTTAITFPVAAKQHALPVCTIVIITSPTTSQQHSIFECEKEGTTSPVAVGQHSSQDCSTVSITSSPAVEQHRLTDCKEAPNASERQEQEQQLSYVHDFTDCPIDNNFLEYYEKEERKARQHTFGDCPRTSSVGIQSNSPDFEHALMGCAVNGKPATRSASVSDLVGSRRRPGNALNSKRPGEHRLASCPVPGSPYGKEGDHTHDLNCLTESLHHKHRSDQTIDAKGKGKDPEVELASDNHAHDVNCLTENRHHKHHSKEGTLAHGSSEGAKSSENNHRRRRPKKKGRPAKVAEELMKEKEYTTAGDGSTSARPSDAQVALARVLAAQQNKGKGRSKRARHRDGYDEIETPDSGEWFGQKLEGGQKRKERSCSSPFGL